MEFFSYFLFRFSFSDLQIAGNYLTEFVAHFGYYDLFREMISHHKEDFTVNVDSFIAALYPQLSLGDISDPPHYLCSNLASNKWLWNNIL